MALTNEQLILLDNLIYLDDTVASYDTDSVTVSVVVNSLLEKSKKDFENAVTDEQFFYCDDMVNGMTTYQWENVLNAIAADETLMNMKITNIKDDNAYNGNKEATGFRAACFTNGEDTAVIYRGTVGSFQWDDNGEGGTLPTTTSQKQAYQYLLELQYNNEIKDNSIYVSGHSKGGNMAQFASLIADKNTDLNIERCLSFNGQGFSQQTLDFFYENGFLTDEAIEKMYKIASENDVVNSLFNSISNDNVKENITYVKSSGTVSNVMDYLLIGHIGSDILTKDGALNAIAAPKHNIDGGELNPNIIGISSHLFTYNGIRYA